MLAQMCAHACCCCCVTAVLVDYVDALRPHGCAQVARKLLAGLASRRFLLPNSSFLVGLLQSITAGLVPRGMLSGLWEALLGALSPLICTAVAAEHDGVARSGAATRYATLWSAGSAAAEGTPEPAE